MCVSEKLSEYERDDEDEQEGDGGHDRPPSCHATGRSCGSATSPHREHNPMIVVAIP
jgi:hypothetical protein